MKREERKRDRRKWEMSSLSSSSSREKLFRRVISPAIEGQTCPICLRNLHSRSSAVLRACHHAYCEGCIGKWSFFRRKCPLCNSDFDSWFYRISLSSETFRTHRLPAFERKRSFDDDEADRSRRIVISSSLRRRTTPIPWRRSFGRSGFVSSDVIARRKLRWRRSIYEQKLKALPLSPTNSPQQSVSLGNTGAKESILRRIEPWIRREFEAILMDSDPSVIVHVAKSLYISSIEKRVRSSPGYEFLAELRPFLLEKTNMFWHELRCFAESSFNMETYDSVVEYVR